MRPLLSRPAGVTARRSALLAGAPLALLLCCAGAASPQSAVDAELTFNAGVTHLREGRTELAIEAFRKAVKQDPKNPYFYKALGLAEAQLADRCPPAAAKCREEHLQEAVAGARKALELNPYYVDARNDLGAALLRIGDREAGRKELLAAYEDPTNPTPEISARNLGQAYFEDRNYVQAQSWFDTAARRNKLYADAHVGVAEAMLAQGNAQGAIGQLEGAVKDLPDDPQILSALGSAYYRAGRFADAKTRLEQAAAKDPGGRAGLRAMELLRKFPK